MNNQVFNGKHRRHRNFCFLKIYLLFLIKTLLNKLIKRLKAKKKKLFKIICFFINWNVQRKIRTYLRLIFF